MEESKDNMHSKMYDKLTYMPGKKGKSNNYRRPPMHFPNVTYDSEGRFLVMHHYGAEYYYKINIAVLLIFFGAMTYNYVYYPQVFFGKEWLANL